MGVMPEMMSKGPILKKLDARYKNPGLAALQARLATLQPQNANLGTLMQSIPAFTAPELNHVCDDWFNRNGQGWWPHIQPIEPMIRHGLITAIEAAIRVPGASVDRPEPGLPIVFYWICHTGHSNPPAPHKPGADDAVEVAVSWSEQQVTLVIHTPDPPQRDPLTGTDPIFVVKRIPNRSITVHESELALERDPNNPLIVTSRIIKTHP